MENMARLIKRYGSRKLYDTKESCYVSLEKIASWIREGQQIKVIDKKTSEDLTGQVLTHIISEEGRQGRSNFSSDLLHDLIRIGEKHVTKSVDKVDKFVQGKVDSMQNSIAQIAPFRRMRDEMKSLKSRLDQLESSLRRIEPQKERKAS